MTNINFLYSERNHYRNNFFSQCLICASPYAEASASHSLHDIAACFPSEGKDQLYYALSSHNSTSIRC